MDANESQWKGFIQEHLGKKVAVKYKTLMLDILCVDLGLKPAYLYDIGTPVAEKLHALLQSLHQHGLLQTNLNVLQLEMDCLIVNVEKVANEITTQEQILTKLVNVSKRSTPLLCTDISVSTELYTNLLTIVDHLDCSRVTFYDHRCSTDCNVSSLFGLLLGYPAVYWYDMKIDSGENCLSMETLCCVSVSLTWISCQGNKFSDELRHCFYSFSFPACLKDKLRQKVDAWWKILNTETFPLCTANVDWVSDIAISTVEKQIPSVNL